jgi:hypothetical protein
VIEGSFERQHISAAAIKPPHLSLALTHAFGTFLDYADTQQFGSEMRAEVTAKISSQFPPILPPWAMTATINVSSNPSRASCVEASCVPAQPHDT